MFSSHAADIAVRFIHVSKIFSAAGSRVAALYDVSGEVPRGSVLTVIGPSGSGKSTLLALCNLLLTPDGGEVWVLGREVRRWNPPDLRRAAGLVFQRPAFVPGTVLDNLLLAARLHNRRAADPEACLSEVGLPADVLLRDPRELSGGQQQRLSLARTLVNDPEILLLDEITAALDPSASRDIESLILARRAERGTTVLWVTHDWEQARRVGDYTWLLVAGRLVKAAPTPQFFENPPDEQVQRFWGGEPEGGKMS